MSAEFTELDERPNCRARHRSLAAARLTAVALAKDATGF